MLCLPEKDLLQDSLVTVTYIMWRYALTKIHTSTHPKCLATDKETTL